MAKGKPAAKATDIMLVTPERIERVERALIAVDGLLQSMRFPSEQAGKAHAVHEAVRPMREALEN